MFGSADVWGITFGTAELKAVKMSRSRDEIQVLEAEVIPYAQVPGGGDAQEGDRDLQTRQALQALVARHKIRRETVAISVPGNAVFSKFITLPPVEKKRVPEIVKYESRQQIPFPIEEVVWDYQLVKPEPVPGEDIEVALFAMRREIIQAHLAICMAAGLKPKVIQAAPLAFCNYLRHEQPAGSEAVVILDVDQDSTEVIILDGERCWPRSLGVGSQDLTAALQQKFQITAQKAEELKLQAVKSKQADRLFGVMKPVLQNLAGQVQRTLGFYKSQHAEARFQKVCLVGDFFEIPGVEAYFKESLRYEFTRLAPPGRITADEGVQDFAAKASLLAVPLGLGLQVLGVAPVRTNLIPPESIQQERQSARKPWIAAAVVLVGAAVGMEASRAQGVLKVLTDVKTESDDVKALKDQNAKSQEEASSQLPALTAELGKMPGMLKDPLTGLPSGVYSDILQKVLDAVPSPGIWIDALDIQPVPVPEHPWVKGRATKCLFKVDVNGHRLTAPEEKQAKVLEYVEGTFAQRIKELERTFVGPDGKPVSIPFAGKAGSGTFTQAPTLDKGRPDDSQVSFSFHVIWYVNPEYYEARK